MASLEETLLGELGRYERQQDQSGNTIAYRSGSSDSFTETELVTRIWRSVFRQAGFAHKSNNGVNPFALIAFIVTSTDKNNGREYLARSIIDRGLEYSARRREAGASEERVSEARGIYVDTLVEMERCLEWITSCHACVLAAIMAHTGNSSVAPKEVYDALEPLRDGSGGGNDFAQRLRANLHLDYGYETMLFYGVSMMVADQLIKSTTNDYFVEVESFERATVRALFSAWGGSVQHEI